ncbi:NAD-dependent epimerase/dehydratase family protein, partial [Acinetobacter baumannii]
MILVTGATGLLGSHLVKQLSAKGKLVKALYRTTIPSG